MPRIHKMKWLDGIITKTDYSLLRLLLPRHSDILRNSIFLRSFLWQRRNSNSNILPSELSSREGHLEFNGINLADWFHFKRNLCTCASQAWGLMTKKLRSCQFHQHATLKPVTPVESHSSGDPVAEIMTRQLQEMFLSSHGANSPCSPGSPGLVSPTLFPIRAKGPLG